MNASWNTVLSGVLALGLGWAASRQATSQEAQPDPEPQRDAALRARMDELLAEEPLALEPQVTSGELDRGLDRIARLEAELAAARAAWIDERRELELRHETELAVLTDRLAFEAGAGTIEDPWEEVRSLRVELAFERDARIARERDWLSWSQALSALAPATLELPEFDVHMPVVPSGPFGPEPTAPERPTEREQAMVRSLRTLLAVEQVEGFDLIDAGRLGDGVMGPVLFRLLDVRGRLSGSLFGERLRLEGSRSGRSLTIVLEDGYEAHAGVRVPFDLGPDEPVGLREQGGERRITLPHVDPMPWIEALPELFGSAELGRGPDDGQWNIERVRRALNALCAEDAAHGYPRFKEIGGVRDAVLRDVHIESLDVEGRVNRRLFADRVTLKHAWKGVEILCEDGVQVRGDKKAAFLDGRYRIFLPRANKGRWDAERLPGLADESSADFFVPLDE